MADGEHTYTARVVWEGNTGRGTAGYTAYGREHRVEIDGKPHIAGSSDPAFRGDPHRHNPEDLFLASISACHMLYYLSLCARKGVRVIAYEDSAEGVMRVEPAGGGRFHRVTLRPRVTVAADADLETARGLHDTAHELCFIANSCNFPITHEPTLELEGG